jgi:hypothetical protein
MDANFENCYDCPITLISVALHFVLLAGMVALGCWLLTLRFRSLRALGAGVAVVGFFLSLSFTATAPRWGIINPFVQQFAAFSRPIAYGIYFAIDIALFAALALASRSYVRRTRESRLAREAAKLDRAEEQALANEGYAGEFKGPGY